MDISKIEIKDVNFSYKDVKVYRKNLNMCLEKGSIYLIKGKNGSGKSTLAGILLKIWNDFSGTILLDGKSITNLSREILTETIGICFQKPPIFRDTIRNNIALNDSIPVEKYISLLSFYKDLEEMGRTLESELIDTGSVSGGQAQKIGIIRTVCRERSVYIFDEPTSNLDSVSKKEFYDIIEHLKQNSIVILFSHEADAEKNADFIIEL
jgi:ABC-type bacteriocin/lantibiotic exporter with double-glycine peptidase domain